MKNNLKKFVKSKSKKPSITICHTVKGKGFKFAENNNNWHHAVLTQKQYEEALKELNDKV